MEQKEIQKFSVGKTAAAKKDDKKEYLFSRLENGTPPERINATNPWITFGKKNDFPQEVLRLYQNADSLHTTILDKNIDMTAGLGWIETPELKEFLSNDAEGMSLDEVAVEVAFNATIFGGYYLNLVWSEDGKFIAKIKSVPFEKVRIAIPKDPYANKPDGFYISRDWTKHMKPENKPFRVEAFDASQNPESLQKRKDFPNQILFVRLNPAGLDWYTLPKYNSTINQLKLSYEMWNYQLKCAQRGYKPELLVLIPNIPSEKQQTQITADLQSRGGTDEAGDTVVLFGENSESLPKIETVKNSDSDKKYLDLIDKVNTEIYIGDSTNNVVAGVAIEGKLSNASEVLEQYQMHQLFIIAPLQKKIEDKFNWICEINGLKPEMKLKNYINYLQSGLTPAVPNEQPKSE